MNVVLDSGALIAVERNDRRTTGVILLAQSNGTMLVSIPEVAGQIWRGGARQAMLARFLKTVWIPPTNLAEAKRAGELLAESGTADVVNALLALRVLPGDRVLTSDPDDIGLLLEVRGVVATVVPV